MSLHPRLTTGLPLNLHGVVALFVWRGDQLKEETGKIAEPLPRLPRRGDGDDLLQTTNPPHGGSAYRVLGRSLVVVVGGQRTAGRSWLSPVHVSLVA
jgi:hypothetical protein